MPHLQTPGQLKIPFRGRMPRSRRTSLDGARVAVTRAGSQCARMLIRYLQDGALSDLRMAERLGLPESRISARRSNLLDRRLVEHGGEVIGPYGALNALWRLTPHGRTVAAELARMF